MLHIDMRKSVVLLSCRSDVKLSTRPSVNARSYVPHYISNNLRSRMMVGKKMES
jgi:hypothetical protein